MTDVSIACPECHALVPRMEFNNHARDHILHPRRGAQRSPEQPAPSPASTSFQDSFTCWLRANKDSPKYTTIDGQPRVADPQLHRHRKLANQLCEQVKQRIADLVHGFKWWNDNATKEICLEQIQKTLLFPVRVPKSYPTYKCVTTLSLTTGSCCIYLHPLEDMCCGFSALVSARLDSETRVLQ